MSDPLTPLRKLARTCRKVAEITKPLEGDPNYPAINATLEDYTHFADELESLLPALEKAFAEICAGYEKDIHEAQSDYVNVKAEIAALKEPMACGHPKVCYHTHADSCYGKVPETEGVGEHLRCGLVAGCTACSHERLAVAAARREDARIARSQGAVVAAGDMEAILSDSDRSFAEAHDAELIERALTIALRYRHGPIDGVDLETAMCALRAQWEAERGK